MHSLPKIEWDDRFDQPCLRFKFRSTLTHEGARHAVANWHLEFSRKPDQAITLIWDCTAMQDYDGRAFSLWVSAIREMRSQIADIWLISGSSLVRTGGALIGLLTGMKVRSAENETAFAEQMKSTNQLR